MLEAAYNLKVVLILTFGFASASILGYLTQKARLSPILGYLLAGYIIGPYSPGYVADLMMSEQLAEIGVILMMFGVGLHFKWQDLVSVKSIAIPGAVIQTIVATIAGALFVNALGWGWGTGIVIGMAVGVASTVVLVRVLADNGVLNTPQGHIAVGWLIVEDILTVIVLLLLPTLALTLNGTQFSLFSLSTSLIIALSKFIFLAAFMFTLGHKFVTFALVKIARTRSHELFTVTILALTFVIAVASALVFGTSIALGAFIAGMVIGQTEVRHQAAANALPLKDAFVVIFFLSVGMLFNPFAIRDNFALFSGVLAIILLVKPLAAYFIVIALRYPIKTALTIAIALAQIGEFSFILAEEAMKLKILPDEGYDVIVACALVSISLNPLLFRSVDWLNRYLSAKRTSPSSDKQDEIIKKDKKKVIIVGYGPVGAGIAKELKNRGFIVSVIDRNVDTITMLTADGDNAIYGDATQPNILESAQLNSVDLLIITIPEIEQTIEIIHSARQLHPKIHIVSRIQYVHDRHLLNNLKVPSICSEEETLKALVKAVLIKAGVNVAEHPSVWEAQW